MNIFDVVIILAVVIFIVTRFTSHNLPKGKGKKSKTASILDFPKPPVIETKDVEKHFNIQNDMEGLTPVEKLKKVDPSFKQKTFIDGALSAYEMYYEAFSNSNDDVLDDMLAPAMFDEIALILDEADEKGYENKVIVKKVVSAEIIDARIHGRSVIIDVKYVAEQAEYQIDDNSKVIDGSKTAKKVTSVWTWARPVESDDPNWELESISPVS